MLEAETRFRKVEGYRGLATLAVKIEQDLIRKRQLDSHTSAEEELAAASCVTIQCGPPVTVNFHDGRDNLTHLGGCLLGSGGSANSVRNRRGPSADVLCQPPR